MRRRFLEYSRNATAKRRNIFTKPLTHRLKSGRRAPERQTPESTRSLSFSDGLSGNIVVYLIHRTTKNVSEVKHDARGPIREGPGSRSWPS